VRRVLLILAAASVAAAWFAIVEWRRRSDVSDAPAGRHVEGAQQAVTTATPMTVSTPRPVTVIATWQAASGTDAERYSEGRFAAADLRFGERLYIERVCVSDARKLTTIAYRDAVGHTDVPLLLGSRGAGRVDPTDRNCTLFTGMEVSAVEKCQCRFQCAGERHQCVVSGLARRP